MCMNVLLLYLGIPAAALACLSEARVALWLARQNKEDYRIAWGGLFAPVPFWIWCCTFVLSCFGCISTFVLYATLEPPDVFSIVLFVLMNASYMLLADALTQDRVQLVAHCLDINVAIFLSLFVYTLLVFRVDAHGGGSGLLVGTHCCNAASIFHALVVERVWWFRGWVLARQDAYVDAMLEPD